MRCPFTTSLSYPCEHESGGGGGPGEAWGLVPIFHWWSMYLLLRVKAVSSMLLLDLNDSKCV